MSIQLNRKQASPPSGSTLPPQVKACKYNSWDINALANELVVKILANLDACDLLACKRVSKHWKSIIATDPTLAQVFYHHGRSPSLPPLPRSPTTSALSARYYVAMGDWLSDFSEQGHQAVLELDKMLENTDPRLLEQLCFTVANLLDDSRWFDCQEVCTVTHSGVITETCLSPNEQHLLTVACDSTITLCRRVDGQWHKVTTVPQLDHAFQARFSADSQHLVTTPEHATAELLGFVGDKWHRYTYIDDVSALPSFSAQGNYLVVTFTDHKTARIYALVDGQWQPQATALDSCAVMEACFHPIDNHLLATCYEHIVSIWRLVNGQWQNSASLPHAPYQDGLCFSPDGNRLLTDSCTTIEPGGEVVQSACIWHFVDRVWQQEAVLPLYGGITSAHFSSSGHSLVTAFDTTKQIEVWQLSAGKWNNIPLPEASGSHPRDFSHNGLHLVRKTGTTARVWRFVDQQWREQRLIPHPVVINDHHFSPHGNHLAIASNDAARIYGYTDGVWREKAKIPHSDRVLTARFSAFGHYVLTTTANHAAHLWVLTNKKRGAD